MPKDPHEFAHTINDSNDWKVVGSSRRSSSSTTPLTPPPPEINKRNSLIGLLEFSEKLSSPTTLTATSSGVTSPIIWNIPSYNNKNNEKLFVNSKMNNSQRQIRSVSMSMQGMSSDSRQQQQYSEFNEPVTHEPLRGGNDDEDEDDYTNFSLPKMRSRSKSSSAIFAAEQKEVEKEHNYPDMNSIWALSQGMPSSAAQAAAAAAQQASSDQTGLRAGHEPALLHRRASTQPSYAPVWENMRPPSQQQIQTQDVRNESPDRYRPIRRFSHAPSAYAEYSIPVINRAIAYDPQYDPNRRRHSVAAPTFNGNTRYLSDAMEKLQIDEGTEPGNGVSAQDAALFHGVDDYFENTEHRTRAWVEAGENLSQLNNFSTPTSPNPAAIPPVLQYQQQLNNWPLYVVEFKAGRTDFFFIDERTTNSLPSKLAKGELVIVEADRGTDLGKVIFDGIMNTTQLQMYQTTNYTQYGEEGREVHPKRIIRLAHANDVGMLVAKSQDEAKAVGVCQGKIRQRRLPMEVVDAEYQWDRKKLTFYFVAERRIDFRELVRELFKLYKTRIWMCAVNPAKQ